MLKIVIISDKKPGHYKQSLGLATALQQLEDCEVSKLELPLDGNWFSRLQLARKFAAKCDACDLIICAGHRTHFTALYLKRRFAAKAVVLMRPSLPAACFDYMIVPEHDATAALRAQTSRVFISEGVLHDVYPEPHTPKDRELILVGGASKEFGWNEQLFFSQLQWIAGQAQSKLVLSDSRRSPEGLLERIAAKFPQIELHSCHDTPADFVRKQLARSSKVWVSRDSFSMIYEALGSGAQVALIDLERLKSGRIAAAIGKLEEQGKIASVATLGRQAKVACCASADFSQAQLAARWLLQQLGY